VAKLENLASLISVEPAEAAPFGAFCLGIVGGCLKFWLIEMEFSFGVTGFTFFSAGV
jgi:hypothetical protein